MKRALALALSCAIILCSGSAWATEPKVTATATVTVAQTTIASLSSGETGVWAIRIRNTGATAFNACRLQLSIDGGTTWLQHPSYSAAAITALCGALAGGSDAVFLLSHPWGKARLQATVAAGSTAVTTMREFYFDGGLAVTPQLPLSVGPKAAAESLSVTQDSGGGWSMDTELPAAAALGDADANPTTPTVGAAGMVWDGAVWSRMLGVAGRLSVDLDLVNGSQLDLGQTTMAGGLPVVLPSDQASPTGADDHISVLSASETTVLAASSTRRFARVQVGLDTDGPICCVAGATTNNCADGIYLDVGTATSAGGSADFPGYRGVITCRSTSGNVTTAVQSW